MRNTDRTTNTLARIENHFLFNAQHGLSAREQKVILFLVANINPLDRRLLVQIVPLKEIQDIILDKRSGSFYDQMLGFADRMTDRKIVFDTSVQFRGKNMPGYINWFQSIRPVYNDNGETCLRFSFSEDLEPFLLELKQYTQIDYKQVLPLKSGFSIRMYQVFRAYRDKMAKHQKRSELVYGLEDLRLLLGIENKYADWRNFKKRVLAIMEKELKLTDINLKVVPLRQGRKVVRVKFEIADRDKKTATTATTSQILSFDNLTFAQTKAFKILVGYSVTEEIALQMIHRVGGSEIKGFEDWYFEAVINIFDSKTKQEGEAAKAGTLVNWFLKKKIFEQGDHFSRIMERLQARKKQLQKERPTAWDNRLLAKTITSADFTKKVKKQQQTQ